MKPSEPKWQLSPDYGIGIDSYNWKLYRRVRDKKTHKLSGWKIKSYYPTLKMLVAGMQNHMLLEDSDNVDLSSHVEMALRVHTAACSSLKAQIDSIGLDTKPTVYKRWQK